MKEKKKQRKPHQNLHRICPRLIIITRPDKRYLNFSLTSLKYIHYSLQSTCKKENIINNFIDNQIYKGTKYIKVTFLEKDGRSFYILENVNLKKNPPLLQEKSFHRETWPRFNNKPVLWFTSLYSENDYVIIKLVAHTREVAILNFTQHRILGCLLSGKWKGWLAYKLTTSSLGRTDMHQHLEKPHSSDITTETSSIIHFSILLSVGAVEWHHVLC